VNDATCAGTGKDLTVVGGSLGTNATWEWYSDAGFLTSAGSGVTITVDPATTTTYYVRGEGDCNNTLPVTASVTVKVLSLDPTGILVSNDNSCIGELKILSVEGGSLGDEAEWYWYSDVALSIAEGTGDTIIVDPAFNTTYYVRAVGTCNTTTVVEQLVSVKQPSVAPSGASVNIGEFCQGEVENIILTYSGGILGDGAVALWYSEPDFSGDTVAIGNNVSITAPADTTTYFLRFEGDCNVTDAASVKVLVNPMAMPVISGDLEICEPADLVYTVSGVEGSVFNWSVSGGNIVGDTSGESITVMWTGEGAGWVSVSETTSGGCSASVQSDVVKYPAPVATEITSREGVVCWGEENVSYAIGGLENSNFQWNVEEGIISENFGDSIYVDWNVVPGSYEVSVVEITEHACQGDILRRLVQIEGPELDLGVDTHICDGDVYSIDLSGEYSSYLWSNGSVDASYSTIEEGWITVQVGDNHGCMIADSLYLSVYDLPEVELGSDTSICGDAGLILDAGSDGLLYSWSSGESSQQITVYQGERKEISVIVESQYGCISMDTIVVDECNVEFFFRDIPNAITPNGDDFNDVWNIVKLSGYTQAEVEIFSRWGTLVWKSEPGYSEPWDGKDMSGRDLPMDSYHYVIKLNVGNKDRITGIITVIK